MEYEVWVRAVTERRVREVKTGILRQVTGLEDRFWRGGFATKEEAEQEATRLSIRHRGQFFVRERGEEGCGKAGCGCAG